MSFSTSRIEISRSALGHNIAFVRDNIPADTRLSFVVKGNAYGHGIAAVVPVAEKEGVNHFSVFSSGEARQVHACKRARSTVMIMGYVAPSDLEWVVSNHVERYICEETQLYETLEAARAADKKARIHLELETGMNRTGISSGSIGRVLRFLEEHKRWFSVEGVCTHFAGAESVANYVRIQNQIKSFRRQQQRLAVGGVAPKRAHAACSAAAITYPKTAMDMVRVGILVYGFWPSQETLVRYLAKKRQHVNPLVRSMTWKSVVMSKKRVKRGEFVGYGTTFLAQEPTTIAVIPVGYAHGYSRMLSNQGRVLIRGKRLAVIGMVNMNMLCVDITRCPEIDIGDEVTLIGKQGDAEVSVATFGEISNQLNYELLSRLPQDIPRRVVD